MRFFNNTKYQAIPAQTLLNEYKHLFINIDTSKIESIEINDKKITVFGIECVLLEVHLNKNMKVKGKIRWFDKLSGEGSIRLNGGKSVHFYACNVIGANSQYPQLVSNIDFNTGDDIVADASSDIDIFNSLGLINIKKVKVA